jgi:hypothetical protein
VSNELPVMWRVPVAMHPAARLKWRLSHVPRWRFWVRRSVKRQFAAELTQEILELGNG